MSTENIYDRVKGDASHPWTVDEMELQNKFTQYLDEIDTMLEEGGGDNKQLVWLKDTYVIPLLTDQGAIEEFLDKAYVEKEREFYEMREEEENEKEFAAEHGMEPEYWCDDCIYGDCSEHVKYTRFELS